MVDVKKLDESLEQLRAEIEALKPGDESSKQRLDQLVRELEQKLTNPDDSEVHEDVTEQLENSILQFEVSHPRLTGILNDIMVKLGNMGI